MHLPGLGRSSGEGNGNPLQYSCLENPTDKGAWQATIHGVAKSQTQLSNKLYCYCVHVRENNQCLFTVAEGIDHLR